MFWLDVVTARRFDLSHRQCLLAAGGNLSGTNIITTVNDPTTTGVIEVNQLRQVNSDLEQRLAILEQLMKLH
jgi:hypothetical protein